MDEKFINYLNKSIYYNKKEFKEHLEDIYNSFNYNFHLNPNTLNNIIIRWKQNSIKFTNQI